MLDLDRFKHVNDTLGHPAGDALLRKVAQRLARAIGTAGRCGRLGGDEFQVIVPGHQSREMLGHLAQEIITQLSQPCTIEGQSVVIGASVGIALVPEHGAASDELIRNVGLALDAAKDVGRGVCRFYTEDLHAAAEERADLDQDLREAIARGELKLCYEPAVYAANERIVGFEGLMRWNHPRRGWISPAKFVPIAEDVGLIDRIGQWALRKTCARPSPAGRARSAARSTSRRCNLPILTFPPSSPMLSRTAGLRPRGSSWRSPRAYSSTTAPAPTRCSRR